MTRYLTGELDLMLVCDGLGFPEGPVWMGDGSVLVVEIDARRLSRVSPDSARTTVATFDRGAPNGAAIGPDGAVYVCNNGGMHFVDMADGVRVPVGAAPDHAGGSIDRVDLATGAVTTLYRACDGVALNSPNDLVFDAHGGFWFTDMGRSLPTGHDAGRLYYARADGSAITLIRDGMHSPNGIGLSPGGGRLYVAETTTSRIWAHDIVAPGRIAAAASMWLPGDVLGPLPGYQPLDSLAVDAQGNVCAATLINGGITVFTPDGNEATHYPTPDFATTNICFGGEDMRDAWITASSTGRLYHTRWPRPGLRLTHYA